MTEKQTNKQNTTCQNHGGEIIQKKYLVFKKQIKHIFYIVTLQGCK